MADIVFYNGTLITLDPRQPTPEALAVQSGRVQASGRLADLECLFSEKTHRIDLQGRALLPGFHDAHVHIWKLGSLCSHILDLRDVSTLEELKERLAAFAQRHPSAPWIVGRGYNETRMREGRGPTRNDLDQAVPDRPALVIRTCAHIGVANTPALRASGIEAMSADPEGGAIQRDAHGRATGVVRETALGLVLQKIPEPDQKTYEEMILAGMKQLLKQGVTGATDPGVPPALLSAYRSLDAGKRLPLRTNVMATLLPDGGDRPYPLPEIYRSAHLQVAGVKLFADGGLSGATAAISLPYRHHGQSGILRLQRAQLLGLAKDAQSAGLQVAVHAIGDRAIAQVLDVYKELADLAGARRHRIEHCGLPQASDLQLMYGLGVFVIPQPIFLNELGENFRAYLPAELLQRCYPIRSILQAGIDCAFSSDGPVVQTTNPLTGIQCAVLRRDRTGAIIAGHEAVSVEEGLTAYTLAGAKACGWEAACGTLEPGKWADCVVLSGDPRKQSPEGLDQIHVEQVFIGGKCVYSRQQPKS